VSEERLTGAFFVDDEATARAECEAWLRAEPNVASFEIERVYRDDPVNYWHRWLADVRITLRDAEQPTLWEAA
jgi:hypothetical protein